MIKPTIGRVVLFQPTKGADAPLRAQPYPALICYVHSDNCINLAYFNEGGTACSAQSVTLIQEEADKEGLTAGHFAEWMPYQVGQAKKHEAETSGKIEAAPASTAMIEMQQLQLRGTALEAALRLSTPSDSADGVVKEAELFKHYLTGSNPAPAASE